MSDEIYEKSIKIDTNILLINRLILNILFYNNRHCIFISMKVYEIKVSEHDNFKCFKLNFYIDNKFVHDIKVTVYFKREMHIVNDFRVKLFINNDIFKSELILIYL